MSHEPTESSEDASVDRHVPKRMRKSFDKRRGPVAARGTNYVQGNSAVGLHRRRRRHYGL
jgi:hypothetical protein